MKQSPSAGTSHEESPVQFIRGIGPARARALAAYGIHSLRDLFFHVPRRYLDRSTVVSIARLRSLTAGSGADERSVGESDRLFTVIAEVRSFRTVGYGRKARFVLVAADETGSLQCIWFGGVQYWRNRFMVGEVIAVSGTPSFYGQILQIVHPETDRISPGGEERSAEEINPSLLINTGGVIPIYPSSADLERVGLHSSGIRKTMHGLLLHSLPRCSESIPAEIMQRRNLLSFVEAVQQVHRPDSPDRLAEGLRRLRYEEFFLFQLLLADRRQHFRNETKGISFTVKSRLARQMVDNLPFRLTGAQVRVINQITADMESDHPLNRLLQGDVGSGKTVVALTALLIAVENGYQTAFMAPTEILAEQHFRTLESFLGGIDVNIRFLVGKRRTKVRRDILEDVRRGSAQIVVGTHALLEEGVEFSRLGLVIIDEQHRFGVMQRARLVRKGQSPDVLVMTATPIPRTLSLTLYGDLDVSILDELPQGRKPVETILRYDHEKESVYRFTREQVRAGRQAYYVYPLIEESEKSDWKAATVHFEEMRTKVFPDLRLALLHGRLPSDEKEDVMRRFKKGQVDILVATTVIEVGIDVPNAAVMVIENAERFGLSQLHQLRGRVGRGSQQSTCILLAGEGLGGSSGQLFGGSGGAELADKRLHILTAYSDGFRIAEADLELRGPGDFFGTRQSGLPIFRVADLLRDPELLEQAREDAFDLIATDPRLQSPDHRWLSAEIRRRLAEASSRAVVS